MVKARGFLRLAAAWRANLSGTQIAIKWRSGQFQGCLRLQNKVGADGNRQESSHSAGYTICLPRRVKGRLPPGKRQTVGSNVNRMETILIAEDEQPLREALCDYLQNVGYATFAASSGPEALSVASGHEGDIDLLITDVRMPKMNGRELSEALVRLRPGIKTIFMSGYMDDAIMRYCVSERGVAFLPKPFNLTTLTGKVREMLGPKMR